MKKLILLTFALSLFACDGGDDNGTNPTSIEGRWNLTSVTYDGVEEDLNYCDLETYIELNNNGTGIYYLYYTDWPENPEIEPCGLDDMLDVMYNGLSNNTYSMIVDWGDGEMASGTATINNNILTFSGVTFEDLPFTEVFTKQ